MNAGLCPMCEDRQLAVVTLPGTGYVLRCPVCLIESDIFTDLENTDWARDNLLTRFHTAEKTLSAAVQKTSNLWFEPLKRALKREESGRAREKAWREAAEFYRARAAAWKLAAKKYRSRAKPAEKPAHVQDGYFHADGYRYLRMGNGYSDWYVIRCGCNSIEPQFKVHFGDSEQCPACKTVYKVSGKGEVTTVRYGVWHDLGAFSYMLVNRVYGDYHYSIRCECTVPQPQFEVPFNDAKECPACHRVYSVSRQGALTTQGATKVAQSGFMWEVVDSGIAGLVISCHLNHENTENQVYFGGSTRCPDCGRLFRVAKDRTATVDPLSNYTAHWLSHNPASVSLTCKCQGVPTYQATLQDGQDCQCPVCLTTFKLDGEEIEVIRHG